MKLVKKLKVPVNEIVERFKNAFDEVSAHLIGRRDEIEALKLCLLCNGHLMLEGPPGVAKSKLGRLGFKTICSDDMEMVKRFSIQLMPNTQAEEVYGPMSIKKLREEEIIYYNTVNMLPDCHFAYLDETYRASDSLLSGMMGMLNERIFRNGTDFLRCPLMTAIGTTNFLSDKAELEAFHDRWLISCQVKPADSGAMRRKILDLFLEEVDVDDVEISDPISISELRRLQAYIKTVEIPPVIKDLYEDVVTQYKIKVPEAYVSDRRYCQAIRLVQASIFLQYEGEIPDNPGPDHVAAAKYAIIRGQSKEHREAMDTALSNVLGTFDLVKKEEPLIEMFEKASETFFKSYDPKNSKEVKERQYARVTEILERVTNLPVENNVTLPRNVARMEKVMRKLDSVRVSLAADVGVTL